MRPDSRLHPAARTLLRRCALALACTVLSAGAAFAAPAWKDLNSSQQALIKPALQSQGGNFDALPEPRRAALVKGAVRWLTMTPEQRLAATQQFQQWQQLSVAEKLHVLESRDKFRKLSPVERQTLLNAQKQFLETPLQKQQELRDEFRALPPQLNNVLPLHPFGVQGSPSPSGTTPFGLPSVLPNNTLNLPILTPPR